MELLIIFRLELLILLVPEERVELMTLRIAGF